jgi:hypothetical protein
MLLLTRTRAQFVRIFHSEIEFHLKAIGIRLVELNQAKVFIQKVGAVHSECGQDLAVFACVARLAQARNVLRLAGTIVNRREQN